MLLIMNAVEHWENLKFKVQCSMSDVDDTP